MMSVASVGCATGGEPDDVDRDAAAELDDVEVEPEDQQGHPSGCDVHDDELSCLEGGCRWQLLYGVAFDASGTCDIGPGWGLCYPPELGLDCDSSALRCDDGLAAWVVPGPDNAFVVTRNATSCDMPEHFMPCPRPGFEDRVAAAGVSDELGLATPSDEDLLLAAACACGCDGPTQ